MPSAVNDIVVDCAAVSEVDAVVLAVVAEVDAVVLAVVAVVDAVVLAVVVVVDAVVLAVVAVIDAVVLAVVAVVVTAVVSAVGAGETAAAGTDAVGKLCGVPASIRPAVRIAVVRFSFIANSFLLCGHCRGGQFAILYHIITKSATACMELEMRN